MREYFSSFRHLRGIPLADPARVVHAAFAAVRLAAYVVLSAARASPTRNRSRRRNLLWCPTAICLSRSWRKPWSRFEIPASSTTVVTAILNGARNHHVCGHPLPTETSLRRHPRALAVRGRIGLGNFTSVIIRSRDRFANCFRTARKTPQNRKTVSDDLGKCRFMTRPATLDELAPQPEGAVCARSGA